MAPAGSIGMQRKFFRFRIIQAGGVLHGRKGFHGIPQPEEVFFTFQEFSQRLEQQAMKRRIHKWLGNNSQPTAPFPKNPSGKEQSCILYTFTSYFLQFFNRMKKKTLHRNNFPRESTIDVSYLKKNLNFICCLKLMSMVLGTENNPSQFLLLKLLV